MTPIRQIAYFVPDVREAALEHSRIFGSGPYFVRDSIALRMCRHRGQDARLDHSSAYGQWGGVMVEFVQQNNAGASVFHDLYPEGSGRSGLHHVALFAPDMAGAIAAYEAAGHPLALYAETAEGGLPFAMIDAVAAYGHMIELYPPLPALVGFYAMVEAAAADFDGRDVLRC
jgi:hypothetical protein